MTKQTRIRELEAEIEKLQKQLTSEELLAEIWHQLGPYTAHLTRELRYKLQDHFDFDDSE